MADALTATNAKIAGAFTGISAQGILTFAGWALFVLLLVGGGFWAYIAYRDKKLWTKRITAFDIIGNYWEPCIRDQAKVMKIGKGGFELLYLKKNKTWKLAHGGRVGRNDYYFFIMPDGYWYNAMLSAGLKTIDQNGGLISVVTTDASMRAQYTSLEKQIDSLHEAKKSWLSQNASIVVGLVFVLIIGILAWLIFKEISPVLSGLKAMQEQQALTTAKIGEAVDKIASALGKPSVSSGGLVNA